MLPRAQDLYSRQIGAFGLDAMLKLIKMKVLIVGMRGVGVEVAKNTALAGVNTLTLFDPEPTVRCGQRTRAVLLRE